MSAEVSGIGALMSFHPARAVVERQYAGVNRNHAQVRTLRDQARAATR